MSRLKTENARLSKIVDTLYEQIDKLKAEVGEKDVLIKGLRQQPAGKSQQRWSRVNRNLDDLSSSVFQQALPFLRRRAKYLVAELTYADRDYVARDWRGKVEFASKGPTLLTADNRGVNPICPIDITQSCRYVLPLDQSALLQEAVLEFMRQERPGIEQNKMEECAITISQDKTVRNKMGRLLSEEWSSHRRKMKEEYFDILGYVTLGSRGEKGTKKHGVSDSWKESASEASSKILRGAEGAEDLSYWRLAPFKDICSDNVSQNTVPEASLGDDLLFQNEAAKIAFAQFLIPEIDGCKVSGDNLSSVVIVARADAWITANLVIMSGRKVFMDSKELSGVAAFKYLFRSFIQRAMIELLLHVRRCMQEQYPDDLKVHDGNAEDENSIYNHSRESTIVVHSQRWKRNFLLVKAEYWGIKISPVMGPTVDGYIGVEGDTSFVPITTDLSIGDDSSVEGSVLGEEDISIDEEIGDAHEEETEDEETLTDRSA